MICTVIQKRNIEQIFQALSGCEMAEIRLDLCPISLEEISELFSEVDIPLVATCRIGPSMTSAAAEQRLIAAIEAGANFVDVEYGALKSMSKRVRAAAHENGAVFIRSYHDFEGTPSYEVLKDIVEKCRYYGADMVKIVTTATSDEDPSRVLSLYDEFEPYGLIAFCMGEKGRDSRMACLSKGAPYTYAALSEQEAVAPGQWTASQMKASLYGARKAFEAKALQMPASKSFAQRAIIAAALAQGESTLRNYSPCEDSESALRVAQSMGAEVSRDGSTLRICGGHPFRANELFVGESGLLTRLMIPLSAELGNGSVHITGEKTLLKRSLDGVPAVMSSFGAKVVSDPTPDREPHDAASGCFVPLTVEGPLKTGKVEVLGKYGSQLISGLLMALPFAQKNTTLAVHEPKSIPYMFITLDVMKRFGIKIANDMLGGQDFLDSEGDWSLCSEIDFKVKGGQHYRPCDMALEGDWSAAANFLVAGAIFGAVDLEGLDTKSLQADLSIMDILMEAGASLSQDEGDEGPIHVRRAPLSAFSTDCTNCPDLFPIVSVLAAFCQGTSHILGVERLSHKESDRGAAILEMLTKMGVEAHIEGDELSIVGHSLSQRLLTGTLLRGGDYTSRHDHRMVMALKVASFGADGPINIDDETCVGKSFPGFCALLKPELQEH